ncbi:hypothetical protein TRVL_04149 [Trypanosoma vivax]|nr:hypothetical protein TRVL_04149 [Trypanosoma vivax]
MEVKDPERDETLAKILEAKGGEVTKALGAAAVEASTGSNRENITEIAQRLLEISELSEDGKLAHAVSLADGEPVEWACVEPLMAERRKAHNRPLYNLKTESDAAVEVSSLTQEKVEWSIAARPTENALGIKEARVAETSGQALTEGIACLSPMRANGNECLDAKAEGLFDTAVMSVRAKVGA